MKNLYFLFIIFLLISCSVAKNEKFLSEEKKEETLESVKEEVEEEIEEEIVEVEVIEPVREIEEEIPFLPDIEKLPPHPAVEEAIKFYTNEYFEKFQSALERFSYFKREMENIFLEEEVPLDLIYMCLTESLFNPKARSKKGAYGIWQFLSSTAKLYGLKIDSFIDERLDYFKSTKAAAKYLKESLNLFEGDLLLAIASYNCGIGNVLKAQKRCKDKDFWKIRSCLPKETRNFVPSVLASIEIGKNPSKYGFYYSDNNLPLYEEIIIPGSVNLEKLSKKGNFELEKLKELNPELKSNYTPPYEYKIRVPLEIKEAFINSLPYYTAKGGESLKEIGKAFKTNPNLIAKFNKINKDELLKEGQRIFIPENEFEGYHIVKKGENPYVIAKKYGVSLEKFLEVNGLNKNSIIKPGQKLKIPQLYLSQTKKYKVKKGDTLAKIAEKFSTTVEKIMEKNNLKSENIKPGSILLIE